MEDVAASVLLAHELMSSLHLYAVARPERRPDDCSVVGSLGQDTRTRTSSARTEQPLPVLDITGEFATFRKIATCIGETKHEKVLSAEPTWLL